MTTIALAQTQGYLTAVTTKFTVVMEAMLVAVEERERGRGR